MKRKMMKALSLFVAVAITFAVVPHFSITSFATRKGSESCSTSFHDNMATVYLWLINASYTTSDTATYIVDKYYYPDMSSFGTVYSAKFEGTGMYACSSISISGVYSLSNPANRYDQLINPSQNTMFSTTDSGTFVGEVPAPGTSVSFSITANTTSKWNVPGVLNGLAVFQNSPSVTLNAVVIGVDSTVLQKEILRDSAFTSSCWTEATWTTFANALANAKSVANSTTALQPEIDAAAQALISARQGLVHKGSISTCEYCLGSNEGLEDKKVESLYDVSYGTSNMDVFMPANCEGDVSLIVFIHGGAWITGDKSEFSSWAYDACAKYGVIGASVNYRYADCFNVTGWNELDDIQSAVAKIKSMAADRGLNVVKMMTAGHSAGGHLSLMYAYTRKDASPVRPVFVWDMSGPAALYNPDYINGYGLEKALAAVSGVYFTADQAALAYPALLNMSPVNYTGSDTVPTLICHGAIDMVVPYADSVALNHNLNQAGVEHTFITFPSSNHGLESDPDCHDQMMREYDRYVKKYILPGGVPTVVHNYVTETVPTNSCVSAGYTFHSCKDCGKYYISDVSETSHTPGAAATCTTAQVCTVCNQELNPALGHTHAEWAVDTPATCTADGLKTKTCSRCNEVYESEAIPAVGHSWDEGEVTTAPTCTADGVRTFTCTACGETKTEIEPASGHTPGAAATCTTAQSCSVCGAELTAAFGHAWNEWTVTKAATVYETGTKARSCSRCDAEEEETIAKLNGGSSISVDGVTLSANDAFVTDKCQNKTFKVNVNVTTGGKCGISYYTLRAVNVDDGTIVATSSTGNDDTTVILGEASSNTWANTFDTSAWPAGEYRIEARFRYVGYYQNSVFEPWYYNFNTGATTSWTQVSSVKVTDGGHNFELTETAAPSCTTGGYDLYTCANGCGATEQRNIVEALGHTPGEWTTIIPATYLSDGLKEARCTVCGEMVISSPIPKLVASFDLKNNSPLSIDNDNFLIEDIPQGAENLEQLFNMIGCTIETSTPNVGTGTTVNVKRLDGVIMATYTAVISGDLTGDGYVDAFDLALVGEYINTFTEPDNIAFAKAADMFEDGFLDATDLAYLIYTANFE